MESGGRHKAKINTTQQTQCKYHTETIYSQNVIRTIIIYIRRTMHLKIVFLMLLINSHSPALEEMKYISFANSCV